MNIISTSCTERETAVVYNAVPSSMQELLIETNGVPSTEIHAATLLLGNRVLE